METQSDFIEMSEMKVGKEHTAVLEFENTGKYPLIIKNIMSSCGCSVPSWDKSPVKPGKKGQIEIKVKPTHTGYFNKTIDIYGNIPHPPYRITIKGQVRE